MQTVCQPSESIAVNRTTALTSALLATWALVACGGGSNDPAVAAAPDTAGSTPAASPAPTPAASTPEPAASAPEPAASAPEPSASSPEPVASAPEPAASAPAPAASSPTPPPAPVPAPPPAGTDGSYSDKTTFTMQELESCPKTTGAVTLDLNGAHTCLTGNFWGAQTDASRVIMTGLNSPYGCKLNVIPPIGASLDAYHYVGVVEHTTPSTSHPTGEYLETHISMSPNHPRNLDLQGFAVTQNTYSRAVEANGDDVIRLDWVGKGNNLVASDPFEKTGEVTNKIQLVARKAAGFSTWRVNFAIYDSYTPAAGLSCVSTVYK